MDQIDKINNCSSIQCRILTADELKSLEVLINSLVLIEVDYYKD
jgi:hypothetical protein